MSGSANHCIFMINYNSIISDYVGGKRFIKKHLCFDILLTSSVLQFYYYQFYFSYNFTPIKSHWHQLKESMYINVDLFKGLRQIRSTCDLQGRPLLAFPTSEQ